MPGRRGKRAQHMGQWGAPGCFGDEVNPPQAATVTLIAACTADKALYRNFHGSVSHFCVAVPWGRCACPDQEVDGQGSTEVTES